MLFHVTMTHSVSDCPAYDRQKMLDFIAGADTLPALAADLKVKVHMFVWAAPEHAAYALLEADSLMAVGRYVNAIPLRQDVKVTPVQPVTETIEMGKAMAARR